MISMQSAFVRIVCSFPHPKVSFSSSTVQRLSRQFHTAGLHEAKIQDYLSSGLILSALVGVTAFALLLFSLSMPEAFAYSALLFAIAFAFFLFLPKLLAARRTAQAESELPFLLRELAVYLDIGLPFEKALAKIAQRNYVLSQEFSEAFQEIKSGGTVQSALSGMSARTDSLPLKRSLLLLSSIYETGGSTEPLKRTAEELSSSQLSAMRLASSRLSLLSIIFIAVSALIPSFFTVFAAVSPAISFSSIPTWQVWLAFLLIFPALDFLALGMMFLLLPPAPAVAAEKGALLDEYLKRKGIAIGRKAFAIALSAVSLLLAAIFLVFNLPILSALSICIAPAAYSLASYAACQPVDEAESRLSDALYTAASTHRLLSAEKMLSALSKGKFGRLSESFELALRRQKAGESFAASMAAAAKHCPSLLVERAFSLLVVSYETGANMYSALRSAAEDVISFFTLVRERTAQTAMQRYTVLAASAILVPIILGTVVSLVPSLASATALSEGTVEAPVSQQSEDAAYLQQNEGAAQFLSDRPAAPPSLASVLFLACPIYLLLNAALSSFLLAAAESDVKKAALYFAITVPVSQILFAISSSSGVSGSA